MQSKPLLIWINCYGTWDPQLRDPVETEGYNQYLNAIAEYLSTIKEQIDTIYISGGMLDTLGRTECQTVKPELEQRLSSIGITTSIQTDEESLTSISIVKKTIATWHDRFPNHQLILICDSVRAEVNKYVLEQVLAQHNVTDVAADNIVVSFPRKDTHPHSTPEFQAKKLQAMKEKGIDAIDQMIIDKRTAEKQSQLSQ